MIGNRTARVLLIDDDPDWYTLTKSALASSRWQFAVEWVSTCRQARQALASAAYDVVLLDHSLPDGAGLDLVPDLRTIATAAVVMLTATADETLDDTAMSAGVDEYLRKGDVPGELLERTLRHAIERRRAIARLRRSEERFRALVEHSSDAIMLIDEHGVVQWASDSTRQLTGYAPEELIGLSSFHDMHPDDEPQVRRALSAMLEAPGVPLTAHYRAQHRSGEWRHREGVGVNRLNDPNVGAVVINYRDVTERTRLHEQKAHLAAIVESSQDGIFAAALDGRVLSWNPGAEQLYGYPASEIVGTSIARLLAPKAEGELQGVLAQLEAGEPFRLYDTIGLAKSGGILDVSATISPMRDGAGQVVGASCVVRDISARKRAEAALRENERRMKFALQAAGMGVWEHDLASGAVQWSDSMGAVFRVEHAAFPQTVDEFDRFVYADDRAAVRASIEASIQGGGDFDVEFRTVCPDGSVRWIEGHGGVWRDDDGTMKILGVGLDATERRHLHDQFRQAQKMEAIGQLAGGIAHDFNNLLTVIIGNAEVLGDSELGPRENEVHEILAAGGRAAALTRQLLAFSRKQVLQPTVVDLNALVESTATMLRRLIGEHLDLRVKLSSQIRPIHADPGQIEQVLINLVVNARDAMANGGTLTIRTEAVTFDETYVRQHPGAVLGQYTKLSVTDTGVGMDAQTKNHIFEPFFTTKEKGKGTGLGLATVYGVVKQSGGYITVDTEPGRGSTFDICLPEAECPAETPDAGAEAEPGEHRGGETVLLVEDETAVRQLLRGLLQRTGYQVLDASSPAEAMTVARSAPHPINLLITDVVMPGASGPALFNQLSAEHPELAVIFMSGYPDETLAAHGTLDASVTYLQKPFSNTTLLRKVREVLHN